MNDAATGLVPAVAGRAPGPERPLCRHCRRPAKKNRPPYFSRFCWRCGSRPEVRALYPTASKFARRGVADTHSSRPLPAPTDAEPGTPEKLAVLIARAAARQALFHPDDARVDPSPVQPLTVTKCRVVRTVA